MPRLFISYRRDDSAFAAQSIYDKLKELFGKESITFDVNFSLGVDFAKKIDESVCRCDVLLAIIGDRWLDIRFDSGPMKGQRRLEDPGDWVRLEIAAALRKEILVVPVFVGKVSIADISPGLPQELADLTKKVALSVRTGPDLPNDLQLLVRGVKRAIRLAPLTPADLALPVGVKVVPQGLRSFDENDDDFFIYLLPGPNREDGLPERLGFWKSRIEATDADKTFRVGLTCGPSGCGKSSLIRAGLLPRLGAHVTVAYVEATATDTEARLLSALRQRCPFLTSGSDLQAMLRGKDKIPAGKKVLIVLDQFEQYLHSASEDDQDELAGALRQCDGGKLQCVLMVRDDFLTPVKRFMKQLDIPLAEDQNLALFDLFDRRHAKKVLALLGQAYGALPASGKLRKEHDAFLNQAISDLTEGDHVISVRLSLFAQMFEGKEWKPATLKAIGGATGVGVAFLEDSFVAQTAPEENRRHKMAAQRVLVALLPESGTSIKGAMRTRQELLRHSGYARRPDQFSELLDILDRKLRLVTPTDPVVKSIDGPPDQSADAEQCYQLTHDYLVPSMRDWLKSKKKETRRGRAELRLAERSEQWTAKPENRHLPSLWEFLNIRVLTHGKNWTGHQRAMIKKAGRVHGLHAAVAAILLALLIFGGREIFGRIESRALVDQLVSANIAQVPEIVDHIAGYRHWADPLLRQEEARADDGSEQLLHLKLALLPVDSKQQDCVFKRLLDAAPEEFAVVRDALAPHKDELVEKLWSVAAQPPQGHDGQRLRAACALAVYDPDDPRWANIHSQITDDLVAVPAVYLKIWMDALRPVRGKLLPSICAVFQNAKRVETERSLATDILADYAADQAEVLSDLVMDADEKQFAVVFPRLKNHGDHALALLQNEFNKQQLPDADDDAKEKHAKRHANATVALLLLGRAEMVWPLLSHSAGSTDPRLRSYLIDRIGPFGGKLSVVAKRLDCEPDVTIRRALILTLGQFGDKEWPPSERAMMVTKLQQTYRTVDDPGLRASAEWLLRHWRQDAWLKQADEACLEDTHQREQRLQSIRHALAHAGDKVSAQWYVTSQGHTMVVVPGPVEFLMGSLGDQFHFDDEVRHRQRIDRTFAIGAKPVTVEQYAAFDAGYTLPKQFTRMADLPVVETSWYQAASYCNWLSSKEGIDSRQWCYKTNSDGRVTGLKENCLRLSGYRLPSEAELEYATRAGASTSRYYGESEELLPKYAWYARNSDFQTWPVGSLKPNDCGLFDALGNVWCWCQGSYKPYVVEKNDGIVADDEEGTTIDPTASRVLRGGSFRSEPSNIRCADRGIFTPANRPNNVGFRLARTITPE